MTQSTSNGLDIHIVQASDFSIAQLLRNIGSIEEFDKSEGTTRLLILVTECKGASITTREYPLRVGPDHRVNRTTCNLLNFLLWFEQIEFKVFILVEEHDLVKTTGRSISLEIGAQVD